MLDQNLRLMSPAGNDLDVGVSRDEPSHVHIVRPSRRVRQAETAARVALTPDARRELDPAAAEVALQAA
jgi:hypothetical protein